jgi:hypothetical protein
MQWNKKEVDQAEAATRTIWQKNWHKVRTKMPTFKQLLIIIFKFYIP